ncbi:MAG: bL17 family ribosomal protein [Candidatus Peribacter sp.]|nr:bL17 family ribosomal protein [Candidatus Peribacter sp.]
MRHRLSRHRLGLKPAHGRMFKRNLLTSLLLYEQVRTTKRRAQVVAPMVDTLIAMAKSTVPHNAIRAINRVVTDKNASRKIMEVYIKRFASIRSGLTRIVPVGARMGDGAPLVDLMLVEGEAVTVEPKKAKKPRSSSKK